MRKKLSVLLVLTLIMINFSVLTVNAEPVSEDDLNITWIPDYYIIDLEGEGDYYGAKFSEGLLRVFNGEKSGYIDKEGKEVIAFKYDFVNDFENDLACVRTGLWGEGKYGFIDKTGKEVIPAIYENTYFISEGLIPVQKNGKWGFIDKAGKIVIPFIYDGVFPFIDGLATVMKGNIENENWGFINKKGEEIIPFIYETAISFEKNNLAKVQKEGKFGYIDKDGNEVVPFLYDDISFFSDGLVRVMKGNWNNGKYGYVDEKGKEVVQCIYDNGGDFSEGLAYVEKGREDKAKVAFIDKTGKQVTDFIYDGGSDFSEGRAYVQKGSYTDPKFAYIDETGTQITDFIYDYAHPFSEGLACVKKGEKWGYIDKTGKEVIPFIYQEASNFTGGIAKVGKGNWDVIGYGYIDKYGKEIVPTIFTRISNISEGVFLIDKEDLYGILEKPIVNSQEMDSWAEEEVGLAISNNLVPKHLQSYYKEDITRLEFAQLVIPLIEEITSKNIGDILMQETGKNLATIIEEEKFLDTGNQDVIAAKVLGIINGVGGGKFNPNGNITREQAAALLQRTAKYLGKDVEAGGVTFADENKISNYAKEAVASVSKLGVMNGTGKNKFSPKGSYTRQQGYLTVYRLFYNITK